jgi:hypothetical protein
VNRIATGRLPELHRATLLSQASPNHEPGRVKDGSLGVPGASSRRRTASAVDNRHWTASDQSVSSACQEMGRQETFSLLSRSESTR